MMYDNLTTEELLNEVYLIQHKDRLLTLVCERLEMVMREMKDLPATDDLESEIETLSEETSFLSGQIDDRDDEIHTLKKRIEDLEYQLAEDGEF